MTRDDDIRRRDRHNEAARRMEQRARDKRRDEQQRTRERRQREETARTAQDPQKRRTASETKPRPAIRPKTTKRAGQEREYSELRKEYLELNPECHCCIERKRSVKNPATQVHHTAGREGELLNEVRFWMAVCEGCHTWIHGHPKTAHRKAWLISRLIPKAHQEFDLHFRRGDWPHVKRELEN